MHNWFSVGEEVIIYCPEVPEHHLKEAKILKIISENESTEDPFTGMVYEPDGQIGFYLDDPQIQITGEDGITGTICWYLEDLRKKYPPSSEGFQEMMQKIKDNVLERE